MKSDSGASKALFSLNQLMRAAWLLSAILAIPFAAAQDTALPGNHPIWRSMGGMPGTNGAVHCSVVDASGNLYVGGVFTIAGNVRSSSVAKWDGTKWTSISPPMIDGGTVYALAIDAQGNLYAGGAFRDIGGIPASGIARWDGSRWHAMGTSQGFNGPIKSIAIAPNGQVYVGGTFAEAGSTTVNNIARWDGSQWHPLGQGVLDSSPSVNALAFDASGNLYATGRFGWANGTNTEVNNIAKWNGSTWSSLGTGLSGPVYALQFDLSGNLIVAGYFRFAGGVQVNNIGRWNGNAWSAFGTAGSSAGFDPWSVGVRALGLTPAGEILAASRGSLSSSGEFQSEVVRWNGSTWVNVIPHPAITGPIRTFQILPNGHFVLGGDFQKLGSGGNTFHANYLVRWDGARFHRFGNGPNGKIRAAKFAVNDDLIVGGDFKTIGDIEASGIARYDGDRWWPFGSGVDGAVYSLATSHNGEVYAGGKFNTAGGLVSKCIARWDGTQWISMDGGLTLTSLPNETNVKTMALRSDGALFVGGWFAQSGSGVPLSGIARWQNGTWHDLAGGTRDGTLPANGDVRSLVIDGQGKLYAAGAFIKMGTTSTNTSYIASWNGTQWSSVGPTNVLSRPFGPGLEIDCAALSPGGVLHIGYGSPSSDYHAMSRLVSNTWQKIGNGFTSNPHTILFDTANRIYVGGILTLTGPTPRHILRGITIWNGTRWSSLGNGGLGMGLTPPDVMAIAIDSRGNLVLAGDFLGSGDGVVSPFLIRTRTDDYGLWSVLGSLPPDRLGPLDTNGPLGLQNLAAYAMGLDPLQADASDLPVLSLEDTPIIVLEDEGGFIQAVAANEESPTMKFIYRRNRGAAGIAMQVMTSPDLAAWKSVEILSTAVIEQNPEWERIEVTVPRNGDANFLRLAIDLADDF